MKQYLIEEIDRSEVFVFGMFSNEPTASQRFPAVCCSGSVSMSSPVSSGVPSRLEVVTVLRMLRPMLVLSVAEVEHCDIIVILRLLRPVLVSSMAQM